MNVSSCPEVTSTPSNSTQFLATLCAVESIIEVSPIQGSVGTQLTITGQLSHFLELSIEIICLRH